MPDSPSTRNFSRTYDGTGSLDGFPEVLGVVEFVAEYVLEFADCRGHVTDCVLDSAYSGHIGDCGFEMEC